MAKHYNTQNDSACAMYSAFRSLEALKRHIKSAIFFFYGHNVYFFDSPVPLLRRGGPYPIPKP